MRTFSEIDTISKRAARAAGYSWGISEEIGKNIRLLEMFGFAGIKNLNLYFKDLKKKSREKILIIKKNNKSQKKEFCPIYAGVAFLDQCKHIQKNNKIILNNLSYPILIIPFISRASEIISRRILIESNKGEYLLNFNNSILLNNLKKNKIINSSKNFKISFLDNKNSFSENEWKQLYKMSQETFVEESKSLKETGAGAGLTDND